MARPRSRTPSYRFHKVSSHAYSDYTDPLTGRRRSVCLGPWDSEESRIAHATLCMEVSTSGPPPVDDLSVAELLLRYLKHAEGYYVKDGKPTDEIPCIKAALRPVRELYAFQPAAVFGPLELKAVHAKMAGIRRAVRGRLERTTSGREALKEIQDQLARLRGEMGEDDDQVNALEEQEVAVSTQLRLMDDELPRLEQLLLAAEAVTDETKINKILELVDGPFAGRSVLFFTEYKATQSLLLSRLLRRFGPDSATFINGDERADEVDDGSGPHPGRTPRAGGRAVHGWAGAVPRVHRGRGRGDRPDQF